jgi:2-polyprenyl-3-methyl-5-hydroxy-6-metoxy-1,4-benzoquinol methylase
MNLEIIRYYKERANEYEEIYQKAERQRDLSSASDILKEVFFGKDVIEIACGTGYWTERIAVTAASVHAIDINQSMIDVARTKSYKNPNVSFEVIDLFAFQPTQKYDALFGGFIWSHIQVEQLDNFIETCTKMVKKGGCITFMDNNYVPGSSSSIARRDTGGNTYQTRILKNGEQYEILKNFPTESLIRQIAASKSLAIQFANLEYYWVLQLGL